MSFEVRMRNYCKRAGWTTAEINPKLMRVAFDMESGRRQTVFVALFDDTVEFSVQSALIFDDEASIPHNISTDLMRKSCTNTVGMWVLEEIQGKLIYSLMHNCALAHLTFDEFERNIAFLITAVDKFEGAIQTLAEIRPSSQTSLSDDFARAMARGAGQKLGMVAVGALFSLLAS